MEPAHLGRTTSLPCISSPTCTLSPSSSPFSSAISSPSSATSPPPPSTSSSSLILHSTSTLTTHTTATAIVQDHPVPPTSASSATASSRLSFFSLSSSLSSSTSSSLTLTTSSPSPSDDHPHPPHPPASPSSLFKSFTRPILSLYASLRISCLPSSTSPAQRLQWAEEQVNVSSPVHSSMGGGDTEMGSIVALGAERRRVRAAAGGASGGGGGGGEVREVREVKEVSRVSQVSRVSRLRRSPGSVEHSRRSSSLSRWRGSVSRSSRAPSSPSSLGGAGVGGCGEGVDDSLEDVTDCSDWDEEREEVSMAVFNASPLVLMDHRSSSITPVSRLDIDGEKEQIRRVVAKTTAPLHLSFHQLTLENLSEELIAEPDILHLSGHGLHTSDGAYALALEHDNGSVSLLSMPSLARLLSALPHLPKLVVILACHSESAGRVFADAGVEHVICVRGSERILDASAKYLTKFLYASLIAGFSVAKAFEVATRNVEVVYDLARKEPSTPQPGTSPSSTAAPGAPPPLPMSRSLTSASPMPESAKFLLLPPSSPHSSVLFTRRYPRRCAQGGRGGICASPNHGHSPSHSSKSIFPRHHNPSPALASATSLASPMSPMSPLPPTALWSPSPLHSNLPSRPSSIVGREIEVQKVISALLSHRLVNVYGKPKAGKTSVALLAAHFQRERGRWADGVFYVSMKGVGGMEGKEGEGEEECKAREVRLVSHLSYVLGLEDAHIRSLRGLFQLIRDSDLLMVFDDCSSSPSYSFLLSFLLSTTRPRLIAISDTDARHYFALDSRQSTASVEVGGLSQGACLLLIRRLCGENGWTMREGEMVAFASLCRWEAWEIVVRMRRVAMKEREVGGRGRRGGLGGEEGGVREEEEGRERGGEGGEGEGEEWDEMEGALKSMTLGDFIEVIEVASIPEL